MQVRSPKEIFVWFPRIRSLASETIFYAAIFIVGAVSVISACWLIPLIPAGDGLGWDGTIYYAILKSVIAGELGPADSPYYFVRIGAILHLVPFELVFHEQNITLAVARVFSSSFAVAGILLAVCAAFRSCNRPNAKVSASLLLTAVSAIATFAVFVTPAFYPVLADHLALFIGGLSLYARQCMNRRSGCAGLVLLIFASCFIMPALFFVPLFLLAFPRFEPDRTRKIGQPAFQSFWTSLPRNCALWIVASFSCSTVLIAYAYLLAGQFPASVLETSHRNGSITPAIVELRCISLVFLLLVCALIPWAFFARLRTILRLLSPSNLAKGLLALSLFVLLFYFLVFQSAGPSGPNFPVIVVRNALGSPFSSLPAIFALLGPVGIVGVFAALFLRAGQASADPSSFDVVASASTIFVFLLLVNNETRQFISVFPLLVFLVCLSLGGQIGMAAYFAVFSLATVFIGYPFDEPMRIAMARDPGYQSWEWQSFFGRHGPWMSVSSRLLWSTLLIVFLIGCEAVRALSRCSPENSPVAKNSV